MKPATTLALVALATSLGGCKSFVQAFDFSRHSAAPQYALGQADLDEGREHLRAGRVGNSLAPLHRAALNPKTAGEALNALGVAYAKLGRADLAERYFVAALRVDGGNERFAANLDRFYRSDLAQDARLAFAQRQQAEESYARFAQSAEATAPEATADERIVMSGGETRKITISGAAQSQRVQLGMPAATGSEKVVAAPAPRVRVSGGTLRPAASVARPAEITVKAAAAPAPAIQRVRVGQAAPETGYPLRVRLPAPTKAE